MTACNSDNPVVGPAENGTCVDRPTVNGQPPMLRKSVTEPAECNSMYTPPALVGTTIRKKKTRLRLGKKYYEFYNAPVVKFWTNAVSLCCLPVSDFHNVQ